MITNPDLYELVKDGKFNNSIVSQFRKAGYYQCSRCKLLHNLSNICMRCNSDIIEEVDLNADLCYIRKFRANNLHIQCN